MMKGWARSQVRSNAYGIKTERLQVRSTRCIVCKVEVDLEHRKATNIIIFPLLTLATAMHF